MVGDDRGAQSPVDPSAFFTHARPSRASRFSEGAGKRRAVSPSDLAALPDTSSRRDPLEILHAQDADREQSLLPLRYQRMAADPFAFLRGAAAVMASDLSHLPTSGIDVQLCGDAHLSNFGFFASGEQSLLFDVNDFDETLPGPFDWDVRRLAASAAVAAKAKGMSDKRAHKAAMTSARAYRTAMAKMSALPTLEAWHLMLTADWLVEGVGSSTLGKDLRKAIRKSSRSNNDSAASKLTEIVEGQRRFRHDPPLLMRIADDQRSEVIEKASAAYAKYLETLPADRLALLVKYSFVDIAHKVVGVGSVGTRALVLLMESGDGEPLVLQIKQAGPSVMEEFLGASRFANHGQRVVVGQQVMQAGGDPFLGWMGNPGGDFHYYVRQLQNGKSSIDVAALDESTLVAYSAVCGGTLARAHARVGDSSMIAGYLGVGSDFEDAVSEFALGYAGISARDHALLVKSLSARAHQ